MKYKFYQQVYEIPPIYLQANLSDAVQSCLKLNMSLLIANNYEKVSSMMKAISGLQNWANKKEENINACEFTAKVSGPIDFWTSGGVDGKQCTNEQLYSWCSTGTVLKRQEITLPWADENATQPNERCILLKLKNDLKFALDNVECSVSKHVICEVLRIIFN